MVSGSQSKTTKHIKKQGNMTHKMSKLIKNDPEMTQMLELKKRTLT